MRIGLFSDTYRPNVNGITFVIDILRAELEKLGHEVYIFAPIPQVRNYKDADKHIYRYRAIKGLFFDDYLTSIFFPPRELKRIEALKLDLVQFFTPSQVGLLGAYAAIKYNIPLVSQYSTDLYEYVAHYPASVPGVVGLALTAPIALQSDTEELRRIYKRLRQNDVEGAWAQKLTAKMMTIIHNRCSQVIVLSRKMQHQLKGWDTQSPISLIPTGVDPLPASEQSRAEIREQFGIDADEKIIMYAGRLGAEKNIDLLIDAFKLSLKDLPKSKLFIVGDGMHRKKLEERAGSHKDADQIVFTGFWERQDLGGMYAAADLFVFPSLTDTQGLVLHEAAHAGLPLIVVDSHVSEVLKDNQNGFIVKNNASQMAKAIVKCFSNEANYKKMSDKSRHLAALYSQEKQAKKLEKLYLDLAGEGVPAKTSKRDDKKTSLSAELTAFSLTNPDK